MAIWGISAARETGVSAPGEEFQQTGALRVFARAGVSSLDPGLRQHVAHRPSENLEARTGSSCPGANRIVNAEVVIIQRVGCSHEILCSTSSSSSRAL